MAGIVGTADLAGNMIEAAEDIRGVVSGREQARDLALLDGDIQTLPAEPLELAPPADFLLRHRVIFHSKVSAASGICFISRQLLENRLGASLSAAADIIHTFLPHGADFFRPGLRLGG